MKRLVLSNSHGGNRFTLEEAGLRLREERGMLVVKTNYFLFPRPNGVNLPESEWRHGLHGGAIETAMMMHLRPDLVRTTETQNVRSLAEELEPIIHRVTPDGNAVSFSWLAGDLSHSGSTGNATLANATMGRQLVACYGAALAEVIREAKAFPLDRLSEG